MPTKTARSRAAQPDTNDAALDTWAQRTYTATLPSGHVQTYRLPSLGEMAALGDLPSELHEIAVAEWSQPGVAADIAAAPFLKLRESDPDPTPEKLEQATEQSRAIAVLIGRLNRRVVAAAMVSPSATPEQLERMPYRDLEMLSMLVNRGLGVDAAGRHVGVVPLDTFREVARAHGVECDGAPTCQACVEAGRELAQLQ